jgi:hypothetical protein
VAVQEGERDMTQEEIIELANKAHAYIDRRFMVASSTGIASFEHFARLVAEREREACAKLVDHILKEGGGTYGDAIRERNKK